VDGEVRSQSFNTQAPSSQSSDVTSNRTATSQTFSRKRKMSPTYSALPLVNDRLQDLGKEGMFEINGKNFVSKSRILVADLIRENHDPVYIAHPRIKQSCGLLAGSFGGREYIRLLNNI